ncbi:MAG: hypothetical protein AAB131_11650 [Actinomycetota bacterium]
MELSFIINAVRRYWWLFIACIVVGTIPGFLSSRGDEVAFVSVGTILVTPPSESLVQVSFSNDPDRYVVGQLSVLRSEHLAEQVAAKVGQDLTTGDVGGSIAFTHAPKTDIVDITGRTASAELSRDIVDAYITLYFESLRTQVDESQQPEIDLLNEQLVDLRQAVSVVDLAILARMEPYLNPVPNAQGTYPPQPSINEVAPDLVSEKEVLLNEYNQVLSTKTQLDLSGKLRVTSVPVQRATLPVAPEVESNTLLLAAGGVAGVLLGLIACVLVARLSNKALDQNQIAELLGQQIVGEFPSSRVLAKNRRAALENLPPRVQEFVDFLCVRAEAHSRANESLSVVVVGTERSAGTTTLAAAMANRFAANGSQVTLIDVDPRNPELTRLFAAGSPGIPALLAATTDHGALPKRGRDGLRLDPYSPTTIRGLSVVGIGDKADSTGLRRQNVPDLIATAAAHSHVVVFDGGPLMDAASSVQLAQLCDTLVLAVPMRRQLTRTLATIATQVRGRRGELLPVSMPATRSRSTRGAASASQAPLGLAGEPDIVERPRVEVLPPR